MVDIKKNKTFPVVNVAVNFLIDYCDHRFDKALSVENNEFLFFSSRITSKK